MKIHLISPFYRTHLIPTIIHYFEPMGIEWHPMVAPERDLFPKLDWIHPHHCKELWRVSKEVPGEACFRKINDYLDTQPIVDDDYYGFLTDDDMYEPGFFDVIRQQTEKVIFCSLYAGDSIPNDEVARHPTHPLIIRSPGDVAVCRIGLPQYIIKGEIFKQNRFSVTCYEGDGHYAVWLKNTFPNNLKFIPDLWVLAGYLQPGRYTTADAFIKSNWELPRFIGMD